MQKIWAASCQRDTPSPACFHTNATLGADEAEQSQRADEGQTRGDWKALVRRCPIDLQVSLSGGKPTAHHARQIQAALHIPCEITQPGFLHVDNLSRAVVGETLSR